MGRYDELSAENLRALTLKGKLSHDHMTEEDYAALLALESENDNPDDRIIDFCFKGLSAFPKYSGINVRDFELEDLFK